MIHYTLITKSESQKKENPLITETLKKPRRCSFHIRCKTYLAFIAETKILSSSRKKKECTSFPGNNFFGLIFLGIVFWLVIFVELG